MWKVVSSIYTSYIYIYIYHIHKYIYIYIYIVYYIIYIHMNLYTLLYNDLHNPVLELYDISHRIGTQNDDTWAMALAWPGLRKQVLNHTINKMGKGINHYLGWILSFYICSIFWGVFTGHPLQKLIPKSNDGRVGTPNRCQSIATLRWRPGSGSGNHGILTIQIIQTSSAIPGKMSLKPILGHEPRMFFDGEC